MPESDLAEQLGDNQCKKSYGSVTSNDGVLRRAVIFIHGMGQQRRYWQLTDFLDGLFKLGIPEHTFVGQPVKPQDLTIPERLKEIPNNIKQWAYSPFKKSGPEQAVETSKQVAEFPKPCLKQAKIDDQSSAVYVHTELEFQEKRPQIGQKRAQSRNLDVNQQTSPDSTHKALELDFYEAYWANRTAGKATLLTVLYWIMKTSPRVFKLGGRNQNVPSDQNPLTSKSYDVLIRVMFNVVTVVGGLAVPYILISTIWASTGFAETGFQSLKYLATIKITLILLLVFLPIQMTVEVLLIWFHRFTAKPWFSVLTMLQIAYVLWMLKHMAGIGSFEFQSTWRLMFILFLFYGHASVLTGGLPPDTTKKQNQGDNGLRIFLILINLILTILLLHLSIVSSSLFDYFHVLRHDFWINFDYTKYASTIFWFFISSVIAFGLGIGWKHFLRPRRLKILLAILAFLIFEYFFGLVRGRTYPVFIIIFPFLLTLTIIFLQFVRHFVVGYLGDLAVYMSDNEVEESYQIRWDIIGETKKLIDYVVNQNYDDIVIVSHSQGSIVGYDTLNLILDPKVADKPIKAREKIRHFFTLGSPLEQVWYYFRDKTKPDDKIYQDILTERYGYKDSDAGPDSKFANMDWDNIWALSDIASNPLVNYGDKVTNHNDSTFLEYVIFAHLMYWQSEFAMDIIGRRVFSSKIHGEKKD